MTDISAEMVQKLRELTHVGMMECKRALVEAGGDMETATRILRERGLAVASRKAGREARQGVIASGRTPDGRVASLVEINCETDFVARNEKFQRLAQSLAEQACTSDAPLAEVAREQVVARIAELGENIVVRRQVCFQVTRPGVLASYIHPGGKIGVLLELGCGQMATAETAEFRETAKDLTLQVAASAPRYLSRAEVPATEIASEREIYAKQIHGKPPAVVEKIIDGKLQKFFAEVCLLEQPFVKDPQCTVDTFLKQAAAQVRDTITVRRFVRYQVGE